MVYFGAPAGILHEKRSLTGQYLAGTRTIPVPVRRRQPRSGYAVTVLGATQCLKDIDVVLPLGLLVCVTGVSGSGKSTLVHEVLYNGLQKPVALLWARQGPAGPFRAASAWMRWSWWTSRPLGDARANPVTYVKAYDHIRRLFAATSAARERGFTASTFSFNAPGGRCEGCQGSGFEKVEMQFLSDILCSAQTVRRVFVPRS